ncbi:MAG: hypothetical protein KF816_03995 [Melioribacteraceae bacterium]|nr:hypothetical protein [Melioribacteraceae bacterium]
MKSIKKLIELFSKKSVSPPLLIIKKGGTDEIGKEYKSIDEAIDDLERDPNVPSDKIKELKESLKKLKNKKSITIRNGEIIK